MTNPLPTISSPWIALLALGLVAGCSEPVPPDLGPASPPAAIPAVEIQAGPTPAPVQDATTNESVAIMPVPPREHLPKPDDSPCRGGGSEGVIVRDAAIHRWTDAQGIRHFSDQAPVGAASDHRVIAVPGTPPVAIQASGYDVNLPTDLNQRAVADALAIDRILRETLGVTGEHHLRLKIVFVQSRETYATLINEPRLASSDGAYSARNQTVYVRMQPNEELTFQILRHEITHALLHERVGNLSLPINEGIAAYFERLRTVAQGGQVDIAGTRELTLRMTPTDASLALVDLLSSSPDTFYGASRDSNYVRAFALIARMMQEASGRAALAELLKQQYAQPCAPIAAERVFAASYRGGLNQLANDWQRWMQAPTANVHAF